MPSDASPTGRNPEVISAALDAVSFQLVDRDLLGGSIAELADPRAVVGRNHLCDQTRKPSERSTNRKFAHSTPLRDCFRDLNQGGWSSAKEARRLTSGSIQTDDSRDNGENQPATPTPDGTKRLGLSTRSLN